MKTVGEVLHLATSFLQQRGQSRARRLSEEVLAFVLRMKRLDLYMQFDRPVEEKELAQLREPLKRLAKDEPIEYILGTVEFYGCQIAVDPSVLIPRQETEILVQHILKKNKGGIVWDLCTGSGCLGVALKKARPDWNVTLSDISLEALALAKKNAEQNEVEVRIVQGDLLAPFNGQKADLIVCNPPYISTSEYLNLQPSVRNFEPRLALVGGEKGTEFYERLSLGLPSFLKEGGLVFLEIGAGQGTLLQTIFREGGWTSTKVEKDWAGQPRFFFLEK
jgi:release factor glutamine methyltransferase